MKDLYRLLDQAIKLHGSGNLAEAAIGRPPSRKWNSRHL
jgi:hypothetical protein